jgi:hypothetical protein
MPTPGGSSARAQKPQFAAGLEHPPHLGQRAANIGHEHSTSDATAASKRRREAVAWPATAPARRPLGGGLASAQCVVWSTATTSATVSG